MNGQIPASTLEAGVVFPWRGEDVVVVNRDDAAGLLGTDYRGTVIVSISTGRMALLSPDSVVWLSKP